MCIKPIWTYGIQLLGFLLRLHHPTHSAFPSMPPGTHPALHPTLLLTSKPQPGGYNPYTSHGYDPMYIGEKEPEDKEPYLDSFTKEHPHYYNPVYSVEKPIYPSYKPWNYTPLHSAKPLPKSDYTSPSDKPAFNFQGQPLSSRGGLQRRPLSELLEPRTSIPWSSIVRDPWWWDYPELKPYKSPYSYPYSSSVPFYLRDSYLSPVKRQYLWARHPIRPLSGLY